jgi:hypothetical protein
MFSRKYRPAAMLALIACMQGLVFVLADAGAIRRAQGGWLILQLLGDFLTGASLLLIVGVTIYGSFTVRTRWLLLGCASLGFAAGTALLSYPTGFAVLWMLPLVGALLAFACLTQWVRLSAASARGHWAWLLRSLELLRSYLADEPASFESREAAKSAARMSGDDRQ